MRFYENQIHIFISKKNRKISETSEKSIKVFISNSEGWDVED